MYYSTVTLGVDGRRIPMMFYCWFTDLVLLGGKYLYPALRHSPATREILKYYSDMAERDFDTFFDKYYWPCITAWDIEY